VEQIEPTEFKARWWATENKVIVRLRAVRDFLIQCLTDVGMPLDKAVFTVDARLDKDMQGDHIRGVGSLPLSCETMRRKDVDPNPSIKILSESTTTALLDGGNGWQYCLGYDAMRLCIQKARSHGLAMVGIRAQLGVLEPYMRMAASEHLIGFGTIQGPPVIAPTGGSKPTIGNNPTGFGFPTQKGAPVVLDISFSQSSVTPIFMAAKLGQKIPQGLVLDQDGNPYEVGDHVKGQGYIVKVETQNQRAGMGAYTKKYIYTYADEPLEATAPVPAPAPADTSTPSKKGSPNVGDYVEGKGWVTGKQRSRHGFTYSYSQEDPNK